ncbi:unnamed protein product [Sphenostylis stenocarpa]|uniref:Uncharacterized protein n=1 Tax=Sphenostylis stenocarpa TaxID=92480 RepID=A0AA86SXG4_9FABA|nr:unnamed protein product [Sphenostylis stenocarpa]CAJ1969869.1 unnamed protein product [Sphenostylis stenocarpa]
MDLRLTRKARGKILGTSAVKASLVIVAIASLKLKAWFRLSGMPAFKESQESHWFGSVPRLRHLKMQCPSFPSVRMPLQSIAQRPMASIPRAFPEKVLLSGFKLWLRLRNDLPD